jgi:hypothetical protein
LAFNHRLRLDNPEVRVGADGKKKLEGKYLGPPGGGNRLYIPRGVTPKQLADTSIPIVIVEGEKKALALWRLANHEMEQPRFIPIAIAGVWNWRGKIGRAAGPNGEWLDVKGPIADLSRIAWAERRVSLVFDTNVHTNESVKWARKGIWKELAGRRGKVSFVTLPEDCGVNGVDDLLHAWGPARVLALFEKAAAATDLSIVVPTQFRSGPDGMFRFTNRDDLLTRVQMTNYSAVVVTNVVLDDGVEKKRELEIECELLGRKHNFTISASEFVSMDWPIKQMGSYAVTFPNQREYARAAIQSLSPTAVERRTYSHTGWRNVGDQWIYLHACGAIGASGLLSGVSVQLQGSMSRYELRVSAPEAAVATIRASLGLVDLGPAQISFALLAATARAV